MSLSKKKEQRAIKELEDAIDAPRKDHKVRVTINLDGDLLDEIRNSAAREGLKYQPWLNSFLRKTLMGDDSLEKRISQIEEKLSTLEK